MIRAALPCLITALIAVILRDLECFVAAKVFCWRKRRQTQRQAKQDRELRELQAKLVSAEELEKNARIAKVMTVASNVPFPQLLGDPLIIEPSGVPEFYRVCRQLSSNLASQGKQFSESDFRKN